MNLPGNSAENRLPEQQQNEKTHLKSESIQQSMLFIQGSKDTPRNSSLGTSVCSSSTEDVTVTTGSMASLFQVYYELKRDSWACAWRRHWKWRLEGLGKLKNSKGWSGWRIEMSPFFETLMRIWSVQLLNFRCRHSFFNEPQARTYETCSAEIEPETTNHSNSNPS